MCLIRQLNHYNTPEQIYTDQGLEEQIETFSADHPGTVLVIIDTLQMVRPIHDATYANDYRDLSALKRLADRLGLALLLIHHLRKEKAEDVFHRISGTTAISGAVDSSFTLVEERRGRGRAKLTCIGRDIKHRELELVRNADNVRELSGSGICGIAAISAVFGRGDTQKAAAELKQITEETVYGVKR